MGWMGGVWSCVFACVWGVGWRVGVCACTTVCVGVCRLGAAAQRAATHYRAHLLLPTLALTQPSLVCSTLSPP